MSENVDLNDLIAADFSKPSPHVIAELGKEPQKAVNEFNPAIHESPARLTKNGTYALKRGNRKGFVVGKTKLEQETPPQSAEIKEEIGEKATAGTAVNPPPLDIPSDAPAESAPLGIDQNKYAAKVVCATILGVGSALSGGFKPDAAFEREYATAFEMWFKEMGGVEVKAWVNVAMMSGLYGVSLINARKKESLLEKVKNWIVIKYVNFRNKKSRTSETQFDDGGTVGAAENAVSGA